MLAGPGPGPQPGVGNSLPQAGRNLTSAFGFPEFPSATRRLPGTKSTLAQAVQNVNNLPQPAFPGVSQVQPVQETGPRPRKRAPGQI
jgi:hypothetical protein